MSSGSLGVDPTAFPRGSGMAGVPKGSRKRRLECRGEGKGWLECQREGRLECRCNRTGQGLTRGGARMSNLRVGMAWSGQSSKCAPGLARVSNQGGALVSNQGGAGGAFGEGPG